MTTKKTSSKKAAHCTKTASAGAEVEPKGTLDPGADEGSSTTLAKGEGTPAKDRKSTDAPVTRAEFEELVAFLKSHGMNFHTRRTKG